MKFSLLKLLVTILPIVYKVSSAAFKDELRECDAYYKWTKQDIYNEDCCNAGGYTLYFCDDNNRIYGIYVNSKFYDVIDFSDFPIFEELKFLQIIHYEGLPFRKPINLTTNIFKQPKIETLIVKTRFVNDITTEIDPNCTLQELTLNNTEIKELPNSIFKMNNLKKIELGGNSLMNVKLVKFKNSPIECNIEKTKISCYQEGACSNISSKDYKACTEDEITAILGKTEVETENQPKTDNKENQTKTDNKNITNTENKNENKNKSNKSKGILIGGIICIGIIVMLSTVIIVKKLNKKNKLNQYIDFDLYERRNNNNNNNNNSKDINE